MKTKKELMLFTITSIILLFIFSCSTGESFVKQGYDFGRVDKVAVVSVEGDVEGEAAKNQIADFFGMELLKKGYNPVERQQVQKVLTEQQFQATDLTTEQGAVQAGRILNVQTILVVNMPNFGENMSMTAKMIDAQDGSVLWMGSGSGRTGKGLTTLAGALAGATGGAAIAGHDTSDKVIGGVAGGVAGGIIGEALTPQKAEQAQKVIKKMCESLPSKLGG